MTTGETVSPLQRYTAGWSVPPREIDSHLPAWARRSNPIIRRQLGMYWKTVLPETGLLVKAFVIQAVLVILTIPMPFLFDLILPTITAAVLLVPLALVVYVRMLALIGYAAATTMAGEMSNGNLTLLRVTPFHLRSILASHVAACLWRQVENIGLLLVASALLSMPVLIAQYANWWPLRDYPLVARAAMILGLAVSIIRLILEPFMVGMIGMACGAALKMRAASALATLFFSLFYFVMLNLLRLLPLSWQGSFVIEFVLPIAAPLAISGLCFMLLRRRLAE